MSLKNSRAKGSRLVKKCRDFWEEQGYETAVVERTGRFIEDKDMFGVADIVSIKKIKKETHINFIQVTSENPHTLKTYRDFGRKYATKTVHLYQFVWKKRKGWIVYDFDNKGEYKRIKLYEIGGDDNAWPCYVD